MEVSDGMERFSVRARIVFFLFFHLEVFFVSRIAWAGVYFFFLILIHFLMSSQLLPPRFNLLSYLTSLLLCSIFPRDISSRFYDKGKQGPGAKEKEKN